MRAVISDIRQASISANSVSFATDVRSFTDYYAFGWAMPGRNFSAGEYRFGFNGQEMDDELWGSDVAATYKYRVEQTQLGRFFAVDPLTDKYPWYTPYQVAGNKVIMAKELEGLEEDESSYWEFWESILIIFATKTATDGQMINEAFTGEESTDLSENLLAGFSLQAFAIAPFLEASVVMNMAERQGMGTASRVDDFDHYPSPLLRGKVTSGDVAAMSKGTAINVPVESASIAPKPAPTIVALSEGTPLPVQSISKTTIDPREVNFSQRTVSENVETYIDDMKNNNWTWDEKNTINIMYRDGNWVTYDNRRVLAAQEAGLAEIPCNVVQPNDIKPGSKKTWEQAFQDRFNDPRNVRAGGAVPNGGLSSQPTIVKPE